MGAPFERHSTKVFLQQIVSPFALKALVPSISILYRVLNPILQHHFHSMAFSSHSNLCGLRARFQRINHKLFSRGIVEATWLGIDFKEAEGSFWFGIKAIESIDLLKEELNPPVPNALSETILYVHDIKILRW